MRKLLIVSTIILGVLAFNQHISLIKAEISPKHEITCKEIIDCIIDNAENILKNFHGSENQFSEDNKKLVYQLAKQCGVMRSKIGQMIRAINAEKILRPHNDLVKNYFIERLTSGALKNETLYEESVPLENVSFKGKLYVEGYKAGTDLKGLSVIAIDRDILFKPGNSLEGLGSEWSKMSGKTIPELWWFSKESVFFSYGFFLRVGGKLINGILILEKELDYHTILDECSQ